MTEQRSSLTLLTETRAALATPAAWTTGAFAFDAAGVETNVLAADVARTCLAGRVYRIAQVDPEDYDYNAYVQPAEHAALHRAFTALAAAIRARCAYPTPGFAARNAADIPDFNDYDKTEHADVLAVLDLAIEREHAEAEAREAEAITRVLDQHAR